MTLEDSKVLFLIASLIGSLILSAPALSFILPSKASEKFTELYILGSEGEADAYPFYVKSNETYKIHLGIKNQRGSSVYNVIHAKLRNQIEMLPNSTIGIPSPLPSLYEYRIFLTDGEVWENPLTFSFQGSPNSTSYTIEILSVDGLDIPVNKRVAWDSEKNGYCFELFFELWIYNPETNGFSFLNQFVGFWLCITN